MYGDASDDPGSLLSSEKNGVSNFSQDGFAGLVTLRKNPMLYNEKIIAGFSFALFKSAAFRSLPMYLGDMQNDSACYQFRN